MGNCCEMCKKTKNCVKVPAQTVSEIHSDYKIEIPVIPEMAETFSLDGFVTEARVVRVVNGDSIHLIFRYRGSYDTWKCRISGIDAPEPRGGTIESKERGKEAQMFLDSWLLGKVVKVYCKGFEPFGRLLVVLEFDGEDVGETMVLNENAVPYVKK